MNPLKFAGKLSYTGLTSPSIVLEHPSDQAFSFTLPPELPEDLTDFGIAVHKAPVGIEVEWNRRIDTRRKHSAQVDEVSILNTTEKPIKIVMSRTEPLGWRGSLARRKRPSLSEFMTQAQRVTQALSQNAPLPEGAKQFIDETAWQAYHDRLSAIGG